MTTETEAMDDLETIMETLRARRFTESVEIAEDEGSLNDDRIRYYDTRTNCVAPGALRYLQEQGFEIEMAGAHYLAKAGEQRGWMEAGR